MPVPQVGNPVPYGEAPGFDDQQRAYNQVRLQQLMNGAYPSGSQDQIDIGERNSAGVYQLPAGQNVDDRFMSSVWGNVSSPSRPPWALTYHGRTDSIHVPLANGNDRDINVGVSSGMPESYDDSPYRPHHDYGVEEEMRHGRASLPGGWAGELLRVVPGRNYQPQLEMTTPQSPTPPMPPLPQAPPNPNPFYRRPTPSMGQMMIQPPQFAPQQPDTSAGYVPYGGRF